MIPTILLVEDEEDIVLMLRGFLESRGYRVLAALDGQSALRLAEQRPDLILLDICIPGPDGLEVCRRIRDHVSCPILFLTARVEEGDRVAGFAAGGDDYILKPFSLAELDARIRAHLRREARRSVSAQVKFFDELTVDSSEKRVYVRGQPVSLTRKEFGIVEFLSRNPGQTFDRERIYEAVWGYDSEGDSGVVAEHIRRIRVKLAAFTDRTYLETVWGCGYRWKK